MTRPQPSILSARFLPVLANGMDTSKRLPSGLELQTSFVVSGWSRIEALFIASSSMQIDEDL